MFEEDFSLIDLNFKNNSDDGDSPPQSSAMENDLEKQSEASSEQKRPQVLSQVPIPAHIPRPLDLQSLPSHILRSGAVEALIQQNDDLMARLSVSLRRIAVLEEKLSQNNLIHEKFQADQENLKDQVLILKEKSLFLATRKEESETALKELKEQVRLFEVRYAELYTTSREQKEQMLSQIQKLSQRIQRFLKYRENIRLASHHLKKELVDTRDTNKKAREDLLEERSRTKELQHKISESSQYIQDQAKAHESNQMQLVEKYEDQLDKERNLNASLRGELDDLQAKVQGHRELLDKKVDLENELVLTQRQLEELKQAQATELSELQTKVTNYRIEAKETSLELSKKTVEANEKASRIQELQSENERMNDQVESLQVLWRQGQRELEKMKEKQTSLQKLNRELSVQLNLHRKKNQEIKEQWERASVATPKKLKNPKASPSAKSDSSEKEERVQNKGTSRVETLLEEIQLSLHKHHD